MRKPDLLISGAPGTGKSLLCGAMSTASFALEDLTAPFNAHLFTGDVLVFDDVTLKEMEKHLLDLKEFITSEEVAVTRKGRPTVSRVRPRVVLNTSDPRVSRVLENLHNVLHIHIGESK